MSLPKKLFKVTLRDTSSKIEHEQYYAANDYSELLKYLDTWQSEVFRTIKYVYVNIESRADIIIIEKP